MSAIQYLKERQKNINASMNRLKHQEDNLLKQVMEYRASFEKFQVEMNEIQIAIEKLENAT